MTTYYKVLDGRRACNGGTGEWRKGRWRTVRGPLEPCANGLHLYRGELHLLAWLGPEIWVAEADESELIDAGDKVVVRRARIVERTPWDARLARLFAADCAERVLPLFEKERPGDDRPSKAIEAARLFANGEIGRDELAAAWAAGAAAWAAGAAAWDAWAAAGAARDAAWAAGAAAWDAWAAAGAARDAAWDAWVAAGDAERSWQAGRLRDYLTGAAA